MNGQVETLAAFLAGNAFGHFVGSLAALLGLFYVLWARFAPIYDLNTPRVKSMRLLARAVNWAIFAFLFLAFDFLVGEMGLLVWRATARLSLLFIILSELAYISGFAGIMWRKFKCKLTQ